MRYAVDKRIEELSMNEKMKGKNIKNEIDIYNFEEEASFYRYYL